MGDSLLTNGHSPRAGVVDADPVAENAPASVPAWLAARRSRIQPVEEPPQSEERQSEEPQTELEVEFAAFSECEVAIEEPVHAEEAISAEPPVGEMEPIPPEKPIADGEPIADEQPVAAATFVPKIADDGAAARRVISLPPLPPLPPVPPPLPSPTSVGRQTLADSKKPVPALPKVADQPAPPEDDSWKGRVVRWVRSSAMAGVLVSFVVHAIALTILGVLVIGGHAIHGALNIFGAIADPNDNAEVLLDSAMPLDPGQDAAPLEFPDVTQMVSDSTMAFDPGDSLRGAVGGTGKGSGEGGDGEGMSVPPVNVPKYAITKGSFTAWTEPRDPEPGRIYVIIIQVRLPANSKTYRGSDLTGAVIGTDLYKQVIKFRANEMFPVNEGVVQVRIPVPGAAKLVRDTIRVESKLLREKQVLEIEF